MLETTSFPLSILDKMVLSVERVRERLLRATAALEADNIPYAVAGGNAVAVWVEKVDPGAVRNTPDIDIVLRRTDFEAAIAAFAKAGFVRHQLNDAPVFLDGHLGRTRDAVHIIFASEKVRPEYESPAPDVDESEKPANFRVAKLEALVRMKLTSFRRRKIRCTFLICLRSD